MAINGIIVRIEVVAIEIIVVIHFVGYWCFAKRLICGHLGEWSIGSHFRRALSENHLVDDILDAFDDVCDHGAE